MNYYCILTHLIQVTFNPLRITLETYYRNFPCKYINDEAVLRWYWISASLLFTFKLICSTQRESIQHGHVCGNIFWRGIVLFVKVLGSADYFCASQVLFSNRSNRYLKINFNTRSWISHSILSLQLREASVL